MLFIFVETLRNLSPNRTDSCRTRFCTVRDMCGLVSSGFLASAGVALTICVWILSQCPDLLSLAEQALKSGCRAGAQAMWQGRRLSVLNEMLQSVRFTKFYTLEDHYEEQV